MRPDNREKICPDGANQRFDIVGFDQDLSLEELDDHNDFVKQLDASKNPNDLRNRLLSIFKQLGFSDFAFMGFTQNHKPQIFLTTLPEELLTSYQDQRLYRHDMGLDYLKADNPTHFHHSDIQQIIDSTCALTQTFDKNREILALYQKFEFNDAYLMPYKPDGKEAGSQATNNKETKSKKTGKRGSLLFSLMAKGATAEEFMVLTESRGAILHLLGKTAIRVYQNNFKSHNSAPRINSETLGQI